MAKNKRDANKTIERTLQTISTAKKAPKAVFVVLLLLYAVATYYLQITARSEDIMLFFGQPTPIRSLTGVFSSIANLCIFFVVLLFDRVGFYTSLVILLPSLINLISFMARTGNYSNVSGVFTGIFTIVAAVVIHLNNNKIKEYQRRVVNQAVTDRLTRLPNRFACSELMDDLIRRDERFAIACFNLNNFKSINTTMGTKTGDEVLVQIANRLRDLANQGSTGTHDFVTRQGSDEFSLVIREYRSEEDVLSTIEQYEAVLEEKLTLDDCDYQLTASIGYAEYPMDAQTADMLLSHADVAMREAKRINRADQRICRFTSDLLGIERSMEVERTIRWAIENDQLFFYLQPQYDMDHRLVGFEALARMRDADGNMVSPGEFIPVAEQYGLIDKVDNVVFRKAVLFFGELIRETGTTITLSINSSVRHMMRNDFLDEIREVLGTCGVPANQIEIEITESIMIDSAERALECINELKSMGIKIAIDDFGTGYSSLSYLNSFPADLLKIDKSFIDNMNLSESSKQYVAAIISMGHVMNFSVISEGVEETEQLETLRDIGCDYIQGFVWGRPLEVETARQLVIESLEQA